MSVGYPESLQEWKKYISTLDVEAVFAQAKVANSQKFIKKLLSEGFTVEDYDGIMKAFARRFVDLDLHPPAGLTDLDALMDTEEVQKMSLPEGVEYEEEPDEVDRELMELDLEADWDADWDVDEDF